MANYSQVSYGSKGSNVTDLQKLLNKNGYKLNEDGIFGANTQAAVKDYQKKNGLSVDGIVGNNTWGALTKGTTTAKTTTQTNKTSPGSATPTTNQWSYDPFKVSNSTAAADVYRQNLLTQKPGEFTYGTYQKSDAVTQADTLLQQHLAQRPGEFTYGTYQKSDAVTQAETLLQQHLANKPGAYQSAWQPYLDDIIDKIRNREDFSYDLNGDALYQQYKDQYTTLGNQAMMDTMGQAAALTGGYGSSYAQSVGQQAYQGYLQKLNDVVPELYQLALDQYNQEGQDLYNQYGLYAEREGQDYGRYRDSISDFYTDRSYLTDDYRYQSETDYGRFMDGYNMAYGQYRDKVSDWQYDTNRLTDDYRYQSDTDYSRFMDGYNMAYGQHRDNVSDWQYTLGRADEDYWNQYGRDYGQYTDDRNLSYQQGRDNVADQQWQTNFDEGKRQFDLQYDLSAGKSSGKTGNTGGDYPKGDNHYTAPDGWDAAKIKAFQKSVGLEQDGIWGPKTQAAYENYIKGLGDEGDTEYYDKLLGAVSTAKGAYGKQDYTTRQATYIDTVAAINDAYNNGKITKEQKDSLLRIATPSSR